MDTLGSGSLSASCSVTLARRFSSRCFCFPSVMGCYSSFLPSLPVTRGKCREDSSTVKKIASVSDYFRDDSFLIGKPQSSDRLLWHSCIGLFKLSVSARMWLWPSLQRFMCRELGSQYGAGKWGFQLSGRGDPHTLTQEWINAVS